MTDDQSHDTAEPAVVNGAAGHAIAVEGLRFAITRGQLSPGQRLIESELAQQYGVTRASLRQALLALTEEGLVERIPNRGARVRSVPLSEALEITEVRMVLEGLCAAKAAERITDEQVAEVRKLGEGMRTAVAEGDVLRYSDLNRALHGMVRDISGHEVASKLIQRLREQSGLTHQFRLALRPGRPNVSLGEHLRIVDALVARDPAEAEAAMRAHLSSVRTALQQAASTPLSPFAAPAGGIAR
jgi:DNA-binding GntR family transcriptional regulator